MFRSKFLISLFLGKTIMFLNHIEYVNAGWAQNSKSGWRVSAVKIASKYKLLMKNPQLFLMVDFQGVLKNWPLLY